MNADSILLVSVIIAGLIIPSFIIMFLCFNYKSKKTSKKIFSLVACMPLSIAICFLCLSASLINVANTNLNDMKNQQELFKDLVNDLKYYNQYITNYSEITENCDENGGEHYHYIKINYDNVICEYTDKTQLTNKAENMPKLIYNFHALEQPNFVNYFYEYYYNKFNYLGHFFINPYIDNYTYEENYEICYEEQRGVSISGANFNGIIIVEKRSYSHNDKEFNKTSILNNAYSLQQITESINTLENDMDFYSRINETTYRNNAESRTQNIVYICFLSVAIIVNIINIILSLTLKNKSKTINYNNQINYELNEKIKRPNWEELSDEDKQPYIKRAIKSLFENQIKDTSLNLSREKLALKKMALEDNEFLEEDLKEEEKKQVLKDAEKLYESNVEEQVNEVYSNQNVDGKLLKFNFFNMFKFVFLQLVQDKKERVFDERRREYVTKKTTSCTASIPAGPNNKAMYLYAYFRNDGILLMNLFKSYKFGREDIKKIKLTSSNSTKSTYRVELMSGHIVILQVIPERESNILRLFGDMLGD